MDPEKTKYQLKEMPLMYSMNVKHTCTVNKPGCLDSRLKVYEVSE